MEPILADDEEAEGEGEKEEEGVECAAVAPEPEEKAPATPPGVKKLRKLLALKLVYGDPSQKELGTAAHVFGWRHMQWCSKLQQQVSFVDRA